MCVCGTRGSVLQQNHPGAEPSMGGWKSKENAAKGGLCKISRWCLEKEEKPNASSPPCVCVCGTKPELLAYGILKSGLLARLLSFDTFRTCALRPAWRANKFQGGQGNQVTKVTKMVEIRSGRGAEAAHMYSRGPRSEEFFLLYKPMCVRLRTMH